MEHRGAVNPLPDQLAAAYLERLGVDAARGAVDAATLAKLQRAHVTRVPFENVDIFRGRPPGIDPVASVERLLAGKGGYCYHLNGAFVSLLEWLAVDVSRHLSGVERRTAAAPPGPVGTHLGVSARIADGTEWLVDVGLGDGPAEPLPLVWGRHAVDGFTYELCPSGFDPSGWRLEHDPSGWVRGVDFARARVGMRAFEATHAELSTSPASGFVRLPTVMRRTGAGIEAMRGCVHFTITPTKVEERDIESRSEWWMQVIDGFGLAYDELTPDERAATWSAVRSSHEAWDAAGRP